MGPWEQGGCADLYCTHHQRKICGAQGAEDKYGERAGQRLGRTVGDYRLESEENH